MINTLLILYIIGFIITYIVIRKIQIRRKDHTLRDFLIRLSGSLMSWLTIIVFIIVLWSEIKEWFQKILDKELPKWL